jgi:serine/threonine protein kinase
MLQKCFEPNPEMRWTCLELLQHEYFQGYQSSPEKGANFVQLRKFTTSPHLPYLGAASQAEEPKRQPYIPNHHKNINSYLPTLI